MLPAQTRADDSLERAGSVGGGDGFAEELDPALLLPSEVHDDRDQVEQGDRVVLIVEEDADLARTMLEVARERGFKGLVALRGDTGLALAHELKPDAVILDMQLPVVDGLAVLDHLKRHPETRHIPVHVVSGAGAGRAVPLKTDCPWRIRSPTRTPPSARRPTTSWPGRTFAVGKTPNLPGGFNVE